MKNKSGIYEILNTVNGKRYIGSATLLRKRFSAHRCYLRKGNHHSRPLQRAWNKYGEAAFVFRPLLICPVAELQSYEDQCFSSFKPEYNVAIVADNAMRGRTHTAETKLKIGAAQKDKVVSKDTRALIGRANTGRPCSLATRLKRGRSLKGNKNSLGSKGRLGVKHPPAVRKKLSDAHTGVPLSAAHRAAQSAAQTLRWAQIRAAKAGA